MKIKLLLLLCAVVVSGCATSKQSASSYGEEIGASDLDEILNPSSIAVVQMPVSKDTVSGGGDLGVYNSAMAFVMHSVSKELGSRGLKHDLLKGSADKSWDATVRDLSEPYPLVMIAKFVDAYVPNSEVVSSSHMTMNVLVVNTKTSQVALGFNVTDPMMEYVPSEDTAAEIINTLILNKVLRKD